MITMLLGLTFNARFVVTHHVEVNDNVFDCAKASRDGSMVGSHGYEGLHDGGYDPLMIIKGRLIKVDVDEDSSLGDANILEFPKNGIFMFDLEREHKRYFGKVVNGKLIKAGPAPPWPKPTGPFDYKDHPDELLSRTFPLPGGMYEGQQIANVTWSKMSKEIQVGSLRYDCPQESAWRVALKDPMGRVRPLEDLVPGMKGYEARGVHWSDKHWMLVSANRKRKDDDFITLGYGSHLFWIEIR